MKFSKTLWAIGSLIGAQQAVKAARKFEVDDLLGFVGLQRRPSAAQLILPAIGLASLGAVVGAGAALLMAPSKGADLRHRFSERMDKLADNINARQNHQPPSPNANPASPG